MRKTRKKKSYALLSAILAYRPPLSNGLAGLPWWQNPAAVSAGAGGCRLSSSVLSGRRPHYAALPPPDAVPIAGLAGLVNSRGLVRPYRGNRPSAGQAHARLAETGLADALAGRPGPAALAVWA